MLFDKWIFKEMFGIFQSRIYIGNFNLFPIKQLFEYEFINKSWSMIISRNGYRDKLVVTGVKFNYVNGER